jgi:hypothetical protein
MILSGCGGGGNSISTQTDEIVVKDTENSTSTTTNQTLQGKVIDGYIRNATVCVDLNLDNVCQKESEPYTYSDANGSYYLEVSTDISQGQLLTYGGEDISSNKPFELILSAPITGTVISNSEESAQPVHITPLTTLVNMYHKESNISLQSAKETVAALLNVQSDKIMKDHVEELEKQNDTELYEKNLKVLKTIEAITILENDDTLSDKKEKTKEVISKIVQEIDSSTSFDEAIQNSDLSSKTVAQTVSQNITQMIQNTNFDDKTAAASKSALSIDTMLEELQEKKATQSVEEIVLDDYTAYVVEDTKVAELKIQNMLKSVYYAYSQSELDTILSLEEITPQSTLEDLYTVLQTHDLLPQLAAKLEEKLQNQNAPEKTTAALSFGNLKLYAFNLALVDHEIRYDMDTIDAGTLSVSRSYFDFAQAKYVQDPAEVQIFADSARSSISQILYTEQNGTLIASLNGKKIFQLKLLQEDSFSDTNLKEYKSDITLEGKRYSVLNEYFVDFYKIKGLASSKDYDTLANFISEHKETLLFENYKGEGLVFYEDEKLLELHQGQYINGGYFKNTYRNGKEVLFIYPNALDRYPKNSCFILDFNKVWEAECHPKESLDTHYYYDSDIYDSVVDYLKSNFTEVDISL